MRLATTSGCVAVLLVEALIAQAQVRPDLQGTWNGGTLTPLQRPAEFREKEVLTPDEAAAYEGARFERGREQATEEFDLLRICSL